MKDLAGIRASAKDYTTSVASSFIFLLHLHNVSSNRKLVQTNLLMNLPDIKKM